ncbi:UBC15 [Sanghuangporus weigelae]
MAGSTARNLLKRELKELTQHPIEGFSAGLIKDDLLQWRVVIIGQPDTLYSEGFFVADLIFTENYPNEPPTMKFITPMWHPNIYQDGRVCISILHPPGEDQYGYEDAGERWLPVHTVSSIMLSVISLLSSDIPNTDSPANVDAAKEVRENLPAYQKKVRRLAQRSVDTYFELMGEE